MSDSLKNKRHHLNRVHNKGHSWKQAQRLLPINQGPREMAERFSTDAPFQWTWRAFWAWMTLILTPDTVHHTPGSLSKMATKLFQKADSRWIYGRPLTRQGKATYQFLQNRGLSKCDLRISVFTKMIRKDGSVRINRTKIWVTQALVILFFLVTIIGLFNFVAQLAIRGVSWWGIFLMLIPVSFFLTAIPYPLLVLGFRPAQVAKRILTLNPPQLERHQK